jgi:GNAT superfamily N-acetyltransferase
VSDGSGTAIEVRPAARPDVSEIVALLVDDELGREREGPLEPLPTVYVDALDEIASSDVHELVVATIDGDVVGVLQLSFLRYLTFRGVRAQIEGVRVAHHVRDAGVGQQLFSWAIKRAVARRAHLVQLTTDVRRPDALRFYERLGFVPTHHGLQLDLPTWASSARGAASCAGVEQCPSDLRGDRAQVPGESGPTAGRDVHQRPLRHLRKEARRFLQRAPSRVREREAGLSTVELVGPTDQKALGGEPVDALGDRRQGDRGGAAELGDRRLALVDTLQQPELAEREGRGHRPEDLVLQPCQARTQLEQRAAGVGLGTVGVDTASSGA